VLSLLRQSLDELRVGHMSAIKTAQITAIFEED